MPVQPNPSSIRAYVSLSELAEDIFRSDHEMQMASPCLKSTTNEAVGGRQDAICLFEAVPRSCP